jgi:hypothetical protein
VGYPRACRLVTYSCSAAAHRPQTLPCTARSVHRYPHRPPLPTSAPGLGHIGAGTRPRRRWSRASHVARCGRPHSFACCALQCRCCNVASSLFVRGAQIHPMIALDPATSAMIRARSVRVCAWCRAQAARNNAARALHPPSPEPHSHHPSDRCDLIRSRPPRRTNGSLREAIPSQRPGCGAPRCHGGAPLQPRGVRPQRPAVGQVSGRRRYQLLSDLSGLSLRDEAKGWLDAGGLARRSNARARARFSTLPVSYVRTHMHAAPRHSPSRCGCPRHSISRVPRAILESTLRHSVSAATRLLD